MASAPSALLINKTAIVTGGTRGIGAGISHELASRGANVSIVYANPAKADSANAYALALQKLGGGIRAVAIQADLSDSTSPARIVKETLEKLKVDKIHIIVNNAALGDWTTTPDLSLDRYAAIMDTNVRAPIFLVQAALPYIPSGGRIINISSYATRTAMVGAGTPVISTYTTSKAALEGLSSAWAVEFGHSRGITVNAVSVGFVETDIIADMDEGQRKQIRDQAGNKTAAAPRGGRPDDIAQIVAFLASEGSRWVTGSTVSANGGMAII